ncbi:MAG: hypothetical protein AAB573_02975 [Patescibacteria group bacterium]
MWLENLVLERTEDILQPYRHKAEALKETYESEYQNYLPYIQECYERATYWHGTGRYHYSYRGESRYENVNGDGLLDVLSSIIQRNGLTPHKDPWIDSGGKTVSLGTVRMHSRLFARIHLYEHDTLLYEFGSVPCWVHLYTRLLLLWLFTNLVNSRQFVKSLFRRSMYKDLQSWVGAIRKPKNGKVISLWYFVSGESPDSDIHDNYPMLFGITKGTFEVIDAISLTHAVEVRSLQPVALKDFTHIEVPLAKIKETELFLESKGASLRVLPMEFVDMYLANVPLRKLAYS